MALFNWKKRYFKNKLQGVKKVILDLEFKRFKTLEIREEIRQEYDNKKSGLNVLEMQIKEKSTDELNRQKILLEKDIERHIEQMRELDSQVYGTEATSESEAIQGINQQLEGLQELIGMLKTYIKHEL